MKKNPTPHPFTPNIFGYAARAVAHIRLGVPFNHVNRDHFSAPRGDRGARYLVCESAEIRGAVRYVAEEILGKKAPRVSKDVSVKELDSLERPVLLDELVGDFAEMLVERNQAEIAAVAQALLEDEKLRPSEVSAICARVGRNRAGLAAPSRRPDPAFWF